MKSFSFLWQYSNHLKSFRSFFVGGSVIYIAKRTTEKTMDRENRTDYVKLWVQGDSARWDNLFGKCREKKVKHTIPSCSDQSSTNLNANWISRDLFSLHSNNSWFFSIFLISKLAKILIWLNYLIFQWRMHKFKTILFDFHYFSWCKQTAFSPDFSEGSLRNVKMSSFVKFHSGTNSNRIKSNRLCLAVIQFVYFQSSYFALFFFVFSVIFWRVCQRLSTFGLRINSQHFSDK